MRYKTYEELLEETLEESEKIFNCIDCFKMYYINIDGRAKILHETGAEVHKIFTLHACNPIGSNIDVAHYHETPIELSVYDAVMCGIKHKKDFFHHKISTSSRDDL